MKGAGDDSGFFQQGERLKWPQFTTLKSEGILLVGNSPAMSSAEVILTRLGLLAGESWKVAMFGHGMLLLVTLSESNPVVKFSMVFGIYIPGRLRWVHHTLGYAFRTLSMLESFTNFESCVYDLWNYMEKLPRVCLDVSLTSLKCVQRPWKFTPSRWIFLAPTSTFHQSLGNVQPCMKKMASGPRHQLRVG